MSKNVKVNDKTYSGVSTVELPLASGSGKAQFKDVDEITTPSGSVTITENGTHDVTNYASAVVNVASEGGSSGGTTGAVLIATATASTAEAGNGKLTFKNITVEPRSIYGARCTEEQNTDIYELVFAAPPAAIETPVGGSVCALGFRTNKINSSGNWTGAVGSSTSLTQNSDGGYDISFSGSNSYHYRNQYTYNLYKIGTYPVEY